MAERSGYDPGVPCWVDLSSTDPKAAVAFYEQIFGWRTEWDPRPEAGGYGQFSLGGRTVAGIGPTFGEGMPSVWNTYVATADAAATAAAVREHGGTVVMEPMTVLDAGTMAVFQDPTGAFFSCWQAGGHSGAQLVNEPGSVCWNELSTRDTEAAKRFYSGVFGWAHDTTDTGGSEYTEWKVGGRSIAGMMQMPAEVPGEVPAYWLAYFAVEDCAATVAEVTRLGGSVYMPPMDLPVGTFAVLADPQAATFAVIAMAEEPMEPSTGG